MSALGTHTIAPQFVRLRWRLIATALVAPVLCMALNNRALASCGDYVKRMGPGRVPGQTRVSSEHVQDTGEDSTPSKAPCGCSGAKCGSAPLAPINPKTPVRSHSEQDVSLLDDARDTICLGTAGMQFEFSAGPHSGYPLLLNRPPNARA